MAEGGIKEFIKIILENLEVPSREKTGDFMFAIDHCF
jgi:hypothetical protein